MKSITSRLVGASDGCMTVPSGAVLTGTIEVPFDLEIRGQFDGEARAQRITVNAKAEVSGDLIAHMVVVAGKLTDGTIYADKVVLEQGSAVECAVYYAEIDIREGAFFEGKSRRHEAPTTLAPTLDEEEATA